MSLIESLRRERQARLQRIAARAVPQAGTSPDIKPPSAGVIDRRPQRKAVDRDAERAWAAEIMGLPAEHARRPLRIADIQRAAARHFGIAAREMQTRSRAAGLVLPRHVAMYLARELTPRSYTELGRAFGGRDHTTVLHAVNGIERRLEADGDLAQHIAQIRDALGRLRPDQDRSI